MILLTLLSALVVIFLLYYDFESPRKSLAVVTQVSDIYNHPTNLKTDSTEWVKVEGMFVEKATGNFLRTCKGTRLIYSSLDEKVDYLVSLSASCSSVSVDEHIEFGLFVNDETTPYNDIFVVNYTKTSTSKPETSSSISNICNFNDGDVISVKMRFNDVPGSVRVSSLDVFPNNIKLVLVEA